MDVRFNLEKGETSARVRSFSLQAAGNYIVSEVDSGLAANASPMDVRLAIYKQMLNHEEQEVRYAGVAVVGQMAHYINHGEITLTQEQKSSFSDLVGRARHRYDELSYRYQRSADPVKKILDTYYLKNNLRPDKVYLMGMALAYGLSALPSQTFNQLAVDTTHVLDLGGTMLKGAGVLLCSSMALAVASHRHQGSKLGVVAQKALHSIKSAERLVWSTLSGVGLIYVAAAMLGTEPQEHKPITQSQSQKAPTHLHIPK